MRPKKRPTWAVRQWYYDRAVHKLGWSHRMMTVLYTLHLVALMCVPHGMPGLSDDSLLRARTQTFTPQDILDEAHST